jgi:hypothetical protein
MRRRWPRSIRRAASLVKMRAASFGHQWRPDSMGLAEVPRQRESPQEMTKRGERPGIHRIPDRSAPHARWRSAIVPKPSPADPRAAAAPVPRRWPWAQLLRRVFAIQVLVCPRCGGPRRILGAVTEPHAVRRLLAGLGLAAEPPPGRASLGRLTRRARRPPRDAVVPVCPLPVRRLEGASGAPCADPGASLPGRSAASWTAAHPGTPGRWPETRPVAGDETCFGAPTFSRRHLVDRVVPPRTDPV